MIERNVDYIQASLWLSESSVIMKGFAPVPPVRFYKRGYQHPNGFRLYFGNPNSGQALAVAAGEVLQSLRNDQRLDAEVIGWILSENGTISRLDLAVTEWIEEELVTLEDVKSWFSEGKIESNLASQGLKSISSTSTCGTEALETIYIGDIKSRGKKGIFRAYDKGIELNLGAYLSTRLELELKRDKAHNVAKRLASTNDIAGNFRTHFNVKSQDFERLMDADAVPAVRGKNLVKQAESEALDARWDWLIKQVAPSLKEAIKADRAAGRMDDRLISFMAAAGLLEDARKIANHLSDAKYRDKLHRNELVERKKD